jgi:hypothetical protein
LNKYGHLHRIKRSDEHMRRTHQEFLQTTSHGEEGGSQTVCVLAYLSESMA